MNVAEKAWQSAATGGPPRPTPLVASRLSEPVAEGRQSPRTWSPEPSRTPASADLPVLWAPLRDNRSRVRTCRTNALLTKFLRVRHGKGPTRKSLMNVGRNQLNQGQAPGDPAGHLRAAAHLSPHGGLALSQRRMEGSAGTQDGPPSGDRGRNSVWESRGAGCPASPASLTGGAGAGAHLRPPGGAALPAQGREGATSRGEQGSPRTSVALSSPRAVIPSRRQRRKGNLKVRSRPGEATGTLGEPLWEPVLLSCCLWELGSTSRPSSPGASGSLG